VFCLYLHDRELFPHEKQEHARRGCYRHAFYAEDSDGTYIWICRSCFKLLAPEAGLIRADDDRVIPMLAVKRRYRKLRPLPGTRILVGSGLRHQAPCTTKRREKIPRSEFHPHPDNLPNSIRYMPVGKRGYGKLGPARPGSARHLSDSATYQPLMDREACRPCWGSIESTRETQSVGLHRRTALGRRRNTSS